MSETQWVVDSDGSLVAYSDPFRNVTADDVALAQRAEQEVLLAKQHVELGFAKLAFLLDQIEQRRLYLALGYERFKDWVESPSIEISYRVAQDLIRIRRQVVPLLGEEAEGKIGKIGISKVRAMLPLLRDAGGEEKFLALAGQLLDVEQEPLTWNDVRAEVRRLRGQDQALDTRSPALFLVKAQRTESYYRAEVFCTDGVDTYTASAYGPLLIKPEHWPRFEALFGSFVEFVDDV